MKNGDRQVISLLKMLSSMLRNYGDNVTNISSLLDAVITKLNALIEPTPQNKLKAINIPPIQELSREIDQNINRLFKLRSGIVGGLYTINKVFEDAKVKCDSCGGVGKICKSGYEREDDIVTPIYEYRECPTCDGLGYFAISEEVRKRGCEVLNSIKRIAAILMGKLN